MNIIGLGRQDIIELARQAGFVVDEADCIRAPKTLRVGFELELEHFANLVATHEREACCSIVYGLCESDNVAQRIVDAIRARGTT
jgi:hypothetical protein